MTVPLISDLPTPPQSGDTDTVFDTRASDFVGALDTFVTECNALGLHFESEAAAITAMAVAGNLSGLDLSALAGYIIGVNEGGTALEAVEPVFINKATLASAQAGTGDVDYMTPLKTAAAITSQRDGLGYGQTWVDVTASRTVGVTYQNTTGRPIAVSVTVYGTNDPIKVSSDNVTFVSVAPIDNTTNAVFTIVPSGHYYRLASGTRTYWAELR